MLFYWSFFLPSLISDESHLINIKSYAKALKQHLQPPKILFIIDKSYIHNNNECVNVVAKAKGSQRCNVVTISTSWQQWCVSSSVICGSLMNCNMPFLVIHLFYCLWVFNPISIYWFVAVSFSCSFWWVRERHLKGTPPRFLLLRGKKY